MKRDMLSVHFKEVSRLNKKIGSQYRVQKRVKGDPYKDHNHENVYKYEFNEILKAWYFES